METKIINDSHGHGCFSPCSILLSGRAATLSLAGRGPWLQDLGQQAVEKYTRIRVAELQTENPLRVLRPLYFGGPPLNSFLMQPGVMIPCVCVCFTSPSL
jgi:hypothetical protein